MPAINYLRLSLVDRCNFRCSYCMPGDGEIAYLQRSEILSYEELLFLIEQVFVPLGIDRFRLTGGEPLIRRGAVGFVRALCALPGVADVSMTTNGYLLEELAADLYTAGLRRINISLDSLDPEIFGQITGRSHWHKVWKGIQSAHQVGFDPLKLNVVVLPGINESEVPDLAALSVERNWHVRFIEFMPIGNTAYFEQSGWVNSETLRTRIRERFGLEAAACPGNGPADIFRIPGAKGTLGFISQMSECFCDRCNRLRLSADGYLRPCLLNESDQIDLKTSLRTGTSAAQLRDQVKYVLDRKPEINFRERDRGTTGRYGRTMSQIGG
ncbi:GTP 3',8-cyclase MoaA [Gloeobacter kilaueensis]|uniref:GTP 3',8-cyclase n=1 Tax=Gloeobacter kilaueensis (strain ATCC BAA-2537 / CCAP 1431/1 / ULC 316 / JS1) TaxID=1183438 RepID=U5QF09_GLOK1|nr:GTP 3',8-cyclase MoaA [Gloeobacter kilaueensis]AGY57506.1 molybdenum cofactor biosynthesis protein MoaA [Gloeobacter kilaueensis JS1]